MADVLLLALGNPLRGDDGVGPAVLEWTRAHGLPAGVDAVDGGTAGLDLALTLSGHRRAVIVDAADLGRAPGEWLRFAPAQARLAADTAHLSVHAAGLAEALALAEALGTLPEHVVIFGIQPAVLEWMPGLSAAVAAAVPAVGRAVLHELVPSSTSEEPTWQRS